MNFARHGSPTFSETQVLFLNANLLTSIEDAGKSWQ